MSEASSEFFEACERRINEEILPLLSQFPPKVLKDSEGILGGSADLLLYRNLIFAVDLCVKEEEGRLSVEQLNQLRGLVRRQVFPAYLAYFKNHFILPDGDGQASSFFFVRQENNASWAKLLWERIKEIYGAKEREKPEDSHELGVRVPSGVLDVLARLLEFFFPTEESIAVNASIEGKKSSIPARVERKFSYRRFELINFDLRSEGAGVLESVLQRALVERYDALMAKNAFFILNRIITFSRECSNYELNSQSNAQANVFMTSSLDKWEKFVVAYGAVQESQIHLVRPLLPVIQDLMRTWRSGWWRVLLQKGLCNDSMPIRRLVLNMVLSGVEVEQLAVLCTPEGLDFCLEDLLIVGLDTNASFLVASQPVLEGEAAPAVDLGEGVSSFFARVIEAYAQKSPGHGKAIVKEILGACERNIRAPVALIYVLKAVTQASPALPALGDEDLRVISRIAGQPSLHNQRARLLVKRLLMDLLRGWSSAEEISFLQLTVTLHDLMGESLAIGDLHAKSDQFDRIADWLDVTFGSTFLKENLSIAIERFFRDDQNVCNRERARVLALLAVFSLGRGDGRFVAYTRPIFEQLALINSLDRPQDATSAFTLFLAFNETVRTILQGSDDLLAQLGMAGRIFDWLAFIEEALFGGSAMQSQVDFESASVLLEAFSLFIERAAESSEFSNQLIQFLDMHVFSLTNFIVNQSCETEFEPDVDGSANNNVDIGVGFKGLLTVNSAMSALSSILNRLRDFDHLQADLITPETIQRTIRFKLERPGGLSEAEWDQWPEFVTAFTVSKWKCVEAMAQSLLTAKRPKEELLSVLASCLQALEVSKYGGTLSILKCMSTLFDLILTLSPHDSDEDRQICGLTALAVQIFKDTLRGGSETQRWFDAYAEAFLTLFFRPFFLKASESANSDLLELLQDVFAFVIEEVGPKRRGIVGIVSLRMGRYWLGNTEALQASWRSQLLQLLIYGPIRGSSDEVVAARITREHVPDSDYQVRLHALTVLNHLNGNPDQLQLAQEFLVDLLGQLEARSVNSKKRMFPGDFGHRLKLRTWAAVLLLIGLLCNTSGNGSESESGSFGKFVQADLMQTIWRLVNEETMSSTRLFMEWALSRLYLQYPRLIQEDFISIRLQYRDKSASLIVSMIAVALNMLKRLDRVDFGPNLIKKFVPLLADNLLPLLVHNNHAVRMHAIHAFKQIEFYKRAKNIESNVLGYKLLADYIESAEHCQRFINKLNGDVFVSPTGLDPIGDFTLDWIFSRLMRIGGVEGEAIEFYAFINYCEEAGAIPFRNEMDKSVEDENNGLKESSKNVHTSDNKLSNNQNSVDAPVEVKELFKDFQTKIDIYSPFTRDEMEIETSGGNFADGSSRPSSPTVLSNILSESGQKLLETEIIVVASFIDKLPNLAGLARTCEIFGVKTLYVPDLAALASPDFLNVAMTAEKWLDIRQLPPKDIESFLETIKREEGFTVVALEQTSNSVSLHSYTFPKKTCIVLGNERMGIPAEVLHQVDDSVEIPQFGRVRSLNVHVSGSLAVWKAREQDLI